MHYSIEVERTESVEEVLVTGEPNASASEVSIMCHRGAVRVGGNEREERGYTMKERNRLEMHQKFIFAVSRPMGIYGCNSKQ